MAAAPRRREREDAWPQEFVDGFPVAWSASASSNASPGGEDPPPLANRATVAANAVRSAGSPAASISPRTLVHLPWLLQARAPALTTQWTARRRRVKSAPRLSDLGTRWGIAAIFPREHLGATPFAGRRLRFVSATRVLHVASEGPPRLNHLNSPLVQPVNLLRAGNQSFV